MKVHFPHLDGLRFVAFFLVYWQHAAERVMHKLEALGYMDARHLFSTGGIGVSFFFVLSGFLITYLLLEERGANGFIDIKAFYARRVLRIFPLYYAVVAFGFVLYPLARWVLGQPPVDNGSFALYALFLGNFDQLAGAENAGFVGVLWSVGIEEQFYIVWAPLMAWLAFGNYKYLFPVVIIASTAFRFLHSGDGTVLYFHTLSVMSDLAIGGGMAYLAQTRDGFKGLFARLSKWHVAPVYALGFTVMWGFPVLEPWPWAHRLATAAFFAFVIAEQNWSAGSLFKLGDFRLVSRLGVYTYGMYSLHMIVLYFVDLPFRGRDQSYATDAAFFTIGLVATVAVSWASYELFEKKFLKLKRRFGYNR